MTNYNRVSRTRCVLLLVLAALRLQPVLGQISYERIHSFGFVDQAGALPKGQLIEGMDGTLYGTSGHQYRQGDIRSHVEQSEPQRLLRDGA